MKTFWNYIADVQSLIGWAGKGALLAPLVSLVTDIGPPYPSRVSVPVLTCLILVLLLIYIFNFWQRLSKRKLEYRLKVSLILIVPLIISYFLLFNFFVVDAPDESNRVVKGFVLTKQAQSVVGPDYPATRALQGARYDPTRIWEPWTVYLTRLVLLISWTLSFAVISSYLASFVLLQHKASNKSSARNKPEHAPE
jgi:hypothetical protein